MNNATQLSANAVKWLYACVGIYFVLVVASLLSHQYWALGLPIVVAVVLAAFLTLDLLLLVVALATPLAINLSDIGLGYGISLPTEPMLAGIMLIFFLKMGYEGGFDKKVLKHPVSIVLLMYLSWLFITSLTSTILIVSLKRFLAQLWFISTMYFLATQMFRRLFIIQRFVWYYMASLAIVIAYTIINHYSYGFTEKSAHWVMTPFYNDHTAYAAALSMFLPVMIGLSFSDTVKYKLVPRGFTLLLLIAIVLCYGRAAWVGLAVALALFLLMKFKVRFWLVALTTVILAGFYLSFQTEISIWLKSNKQDSSTNYLSHIKSAANVSTDASNLERINRWHSAIRMFKERPILGFGPGTYQFKYAAYQIHSERTIISTNFGEGGTAHSEFLLPLAEAGVLGCLLMVAVVITILYKGITLHGKLSDPKLKQLTMGLLLGLVTYFVQGTLNNFLDTDKAAVPVWGFAAALTAIDIYHNKKSEEPTSKSV